MSLHYNAFISYKHAPQDIKVASEVQRQLERFKIPKAIQQATGIKKIDRIFRDKEELPLTSDLNETIQNALRNSDFQIVICSHASKQSYWVQKEIEFFLQTHTRKQILTVVVDGEPCDVVPEILQYEDREVVNEDGTVETVRVPIEPLSCDYRMSFSKARKTELPRLAAVLLGCNYDDLIQRKRQHRNRQLAAAAVAGLVCLSSLAAYYAWSATQIHENYVQSLRSQSEYLSSESQKSLESGDRLTAMLLALESMPKSPDDDRPVTAAAINALVKSSYAYQTPSDDILSLYAAYISTGNISSFLLLEDAGLVIAVHSGSKLTAWDIETATEIKTLIFEDNIEHITQTPDGSLLLLAGDAYCFTLSDWSVKWSTGFTQSLVSPAARFSPDETQVVIAAYEKFYILDAATGTLLKSIPTPKSKEGDFYNIDDFDISPDGKTIAASLYRYSWTNPETFIGYIDIESGKLCASNRQFPFSYINALHYLDDGTVIASGSVHDSESSMTYVNSTGATYHILYESTELVVRLDKDGNTLWGNTMMYPQQFYGTNLATCNYPDTSGGSNEALICSVGNIAQFFSLENGKTIKRVDFPSIIVGMDANDTRIRCMLHNGHVAVYRYNENVTTLEACVSGLNTAIMGSDILVSTDERDRLLLYRWNIYDENLVEMTEEDEHYEYINARYASPNGLVTYDVSSGEVRYYDAQQEDLLWTHILDKENNSITRLGLDNSEESVLFLIDPRAYNDPEYILKIRLDDGSMSQEIIDFYYYDLIYQNGFFYYTELDSEQDMHYIGIVNGNDYSKNRLYFPESIYVYDLYPSADNSIFLLTASDNTYLFDGETLTDLQFELDATLVEWSPDSRHLMIAEEYELTVYDRSFEPIYTIPYNGLSLAEAEWYGEQLLLVYENDVLHRHNANTGELLNTIDIDADSYRASNTIKPVWDTSLDGILALHIGNSLNLIDTTEWKTYTTIRNCCAYFPQRQKIFVNYYAGSNYSMGSFDLYDNQRLMELTRQLLSELQLSDKQKEAYGLNG